ncbi:hypothetical protein [Sediminibacter sp. Hel_I_10]|uniref:hypothetical protein n=1 Tax=Sediminibacter sp. Hel_I_10 TaxID=1392490 RepID=UPI0012DE2046|nr:hypothetical protein [Sediminibacter sp. Hel_I_10]
MNFSKSTLVPLLGMTVVALFIILAYVSHNVFLDKLLVCGFILLMVLFVKLRAGGTQNKDNSESVNDPL